MRSSIAFLLLFSALGYWLRLNRQCRLLGATVPNGSASTVTRGTDFG